MPSEPRSIDKLDLKRWGVLVGTGAALGALNAVVGQVIPEIGEMGGTLNTSIVLVLTFLADFVRRFLTDTRVIEKEELEKMVVVDNKSLQPVVLPVQPKEESKGVLAWIKGLFK